MRRYCLLFLIIFFLFSSLVYSTDRMTIAILDMKADGVSARTARTVSDMLRTEFVNIGNFTVVERSQMNLIIEEQGFQQTGCTDQECAVQLGKIMSARKVLVGSISPLGTSLVMNVRIVDVEKGTAEFAAREVSESESLLGKAVDRITRKLATSIEKESGTSREVKPAERIQYTPFGFSISGCYLMSQGDFGKVFDPGYGAIINFSLSNILIKNFDLGIEGGFFIFPGKLENVDNMYMIPLLLSVGYRIPITNSISIAPRVLGGYSYISTTADRYSYDSIIGSETEDESKESGFEPIAMPGMLVSYAFSPRFVFNIGAQYGTIFESDGNMVFYSFNAGIRIGL